MMPSAGSTTDRSYKMVIFWFSPMDTILVVAVRISVKFGKLIVTVVLPAEGIILMFPYQLAGLPIDNDQ